MDTSAPEGAAASTNTFATTTTTSASTSASARASTSVKTDQELREIMNKLVENPDSISDLTDDDVIALKQRINPIGTFEPERKSYAVASIINMKDTDTRQFLMTAMIGFVYRRLEEYVPDFVDAMEESYVAKINEIVTGEKIQERRDALREECARRSNEYKTGHRKAIRAFLDSVFLFNPDKHVRKAPSDLPISAETIVTSDHSSWDLPVAREAHAEATEALRAELAKYKGTDTAAPNVRDIELAAYESAGIVYRQAHAISGQIAQTQRIISDEIAALDSRADSRRAQLENSRHLLQTYRMRIDKAADIMGPYAFTHTVPDVGHVLDIAPPADVFYHFGRYVDSHYEILRVLTATLYNTQPSVENAVIYYDTFDELEKAKEFVRVHESEFHADPKIIENGGVTLLGPFRENREVIDVFNKNTEVLRLMMEQIKSDHEIGKNLTKKKIVDAKRKNVREMGPDDGAGLERYMNARGIISRFGKKPSLSREERTELANAEQARTEFETPDGALAMRVLAPVIGEDGAPTDIKQSFFYSEAANVASGTGPTSTPSKSPY